MPTTTPSKTTLKKAAKILQAAHDWIEVNGFDIATYGPLTGADSMGCVPMCYIGTVRYAAGTDPTPPTTWDWGDPITDPGAGDGPELVEALRVLDDIAKPRLKRLPKHLTSAEVIEPEVLKQAEEHDLVGRFVEALGFAIAVRATERFPDLDESGKRAAYEQEYALKLLRKALTVIYGDES